MANKRETMQVVIDETLKREFKSACILDGIQMSEVVTDLIATWLQERQDKTTQKSPKS